MTNGVSLNWPAAQGRTYVIQYKDNLSDPAWEELPGTVSVVGNQGALVTAPGTGTGRYYRLVLAP
jgi:hypothetical protein